VRTLTRRILGFLNADPRQQLPRGTVAPLRGRDRAAQTRSSFFTIRVIPFPKGHFVGIRITPSMRKDSVKIEVSALVTTKKKLSEATSNEIRSWQSEDAGSYEGKKDESLSLSGLARLGLPVFKVKVVRAGGPPPGGFHHPYANFLAFCACDSTRDAANASMGVGAFPGAGKCAEIGKCAQCCRISPPQYRIMHP
jgi:hypothetical protein